MTSTHFFFEKEDDPALCIWEMHTVILLIILENLTKYNNNMPESAILAVSATTPIQMMKGCNLGHIPIPLT